MKLASARETETDKSVIEKSLTRLTHLVRNAIDHGIEPPPSARWASRAKAA